MGIIRENLTVSHIKTNKKFTTKNAIRNNFCVLKVFICVLFPLFLLVIPVSLKSFTDIYFLFIDLCRKKESNNKERKKKEENM